MEYKYCEKINFEDFASGRVLYHKPGLTNFPVRLLQEVYQRCWHYSVKKENITLYDGCCGGGYLLTILGFLNPNTISTLVGSDINSDSLEVAKMNLNLLTYEGLHRRMSEIKNLYELYHKESHKEAMDSVAALEGLLQERKDNINTLLFQKDITMPQCLSKEEFKADIIISDVPYGELVSWQGKQELFDLSDLLMAYQPVLQPQGIIAIFSDKKQKIQSNNFKRLEKQLVGKRKFEIYRYDG